jgi:hypothetical protein
VEVAAKYTPALPGPWKPTSVRDLPADLQKRLEVPKKGALKKAEGKWPNFGTALSRFAHNNGIALPFELWPARPRDLSAPVRHFIEKRLVPLLDSQEKVKLKNAEDAWPRYPNVILELARKYKLQVPWLILPGPREHWENVRARAWEKS